MPGQAVVTIRDKQWQVSIANTSWELTQGLGGLPDLAPNTGMFFDTGYEQIIQVTTVPMLFPIDITFFSESLAVTEVYQNVEPGFIVTPTSPARYFLEVNAGKLEGIEVGDIAQVEVLSLAETPPSNADWASMMVTMFGFMVMGVFMVAIVKNVVVGVAESEKKPVLYGPRGERLLLQTRSAAKYEIETDRMGNIIVTRSDDPGKDVFLQFESDKTLIYDLLRKGERKDLDAGWPIRIKRSEPRGSTLDELWECSAQPQKSVIPAVVKPTGTCYADAWRFLIKEGEGELIHGTVFSGGRRLGHAWIETSTGWIWEPETGRYFTRLGFRDAFAPEIENRYTAEEAAIMAARTRNLGPWSKQERRQYLKGKSPAVIPIEPRQRQPKADELEFLPDSPEFLAYTIDDIGYRERIDSAFLSAIKRAKGR
jgi:uncharacterized membrane protein (UPF0127 family)